MIRSENVRLQLPWSISDGITDYRISRILLIPSAGIWSELSKWRRSDILQDNKDLGTLKLYKYGRQDMTMPWHRGGLTSDKTTMRDGTQDRGEEDGASVTCVKNCPEMRRDGHRADIITIVNCWLRKSEKFDFIFGSLRSSRYHNLCPSITLALTSFEVSIYIFLALIY